MSTKQSHLDGQVIYRSWSSGTEVQYVLAMYDDMYEYVSSTTFRSGPSCRPRSLVAREGIGSLCLAAEPLR